MTGTKKVMFTSDYHIPFMDDKAYKCMKSYAKDYKPDYFVIGGDLLDFYSLSQFDKNPDRKFGVQDEITAANEMLDDLQSVLPRKTKIIYLEGNHETRLQKFLWKNKELHGMDSLKLESLLELKERGIKFIGTSHDYWKNDSGHLKLGDVLNMHGDNRLNGAKLSANSGYSAINTMKTMLSSVVIGHCHRLSKVHIKTPDRMLTGMEAGCLCNHSGTANWQQGFVTYEFKAGKALNMRTHMIEKGKLYIDRKLYK